MGMYVGLDVHSKQSVFVIEDREGVVRAEGAIPGTPAANDTRLDQGSGRRRARSW